MRSEVIAKRYAEALLAVATERQETLAVLHEAQEYQNVAAALLLPFLENPRIPNAEKEAVLSKLFQKENNSHAGELLFCFIRLLLRKGRVGYLGDILRLYAKLYEEKMGTLRGKLSLAHPITSDLLERMKGLLSTLFRRTVEFDRIDAPNILGGFIFETRTAQIDASVKRQLEDLGMRFKAIP